MSPPHCAVLGCGPAGMFFCHAIELKRKVLQERLNPVVDGSGGGYKTTTTSTVAAITRTLGPMLTPEEEADPAAALLRLPIVTVFEKNDGPGGVWRAQRSFSSEKDDDATTHATLITSSSSSSSNDTLAEASPNLTDKVRSVKVSANAKEINSKFVAVAASASTQMYEALWCNAPKEMAEFFDYTYSDHYGVDTKLPSFLSRAEMLQLMLQRVKRNNPFFFDKVKFNTCVVKVTYDDKLQKFSVVTKQVGSVESDRLDKTTHYAHVFDKFICAAGVEGRPWIPRHLMSIFQPFAAQGGRVIHSSNASRLQTDTKNKHVLLIGGAYSAEDLGLMAIKLGAKHVTIACRHPDGEVAVFWPTEWPGNKVAVLKRQVPLRVSSVSTCRDGSGIKCTVDFVEYDSDDDDDEDDESSSSESEEDDDDDKNDGEKEQQDISTVLSNVDTVIFCTGYDEDRDMVDRSVYTFASDNEFECFDTDAERLHLPLDWVMPHNVMTDPLKKNGIGDDEHGNITPSKDIFPGCYVKPNYYNEVVSIYNPNLFFFDGADYEAPLLALDAQAYVMVAIITGAHVMPGSIAEMKRINHDEALYEMTLPAVRFEMDKNYRRAIRLLPGFPWPEHWARCFEDKFKWEFGRIGQLMLTGLYPIQIMNHDGGLNDNGRALMEMERHCRKFDTKASDNNTFRDFEEEDCRHLVSIHTGAVPVPFNKLWMDIDDFEHAPNMV